MLRDKTDNEILRELGARLRAYRLQRNLPVEVIADRTGLSRNTVMNAESGKNPRLDTVVRILRVLGRLEALDAFLPATTISPLELISRGPRPRRRASKPRG